MLQRFLTLKRNALFGMIMLLLGFTLGWFSATTFDGWLPIGGDLAALIGPGRGANTATPQQLRQQFSVFWEVWNLVENEFYSREPLDRQRMIRGAIKGMLESLGDQYTVYQEPDLAAASNEYMQGTFEGIGAYIRISDGKVLIDRPIPGSPALRAGLQQDDQIMAIDGQAVEGIISGLDANTATARIAARVRGPKGTTVKLSIRRGSAAPFEVAIERDAVQVSSVKSQLLDNGIAYIQITDFKATTTTDFDAALRELLPQRPRGLILDLRNNPGGYLTNAQEMLGRFYNGIALYEENREGNVQSLDTISGPADSRVFDLPLAVLINGNSASASEIVAGALRDSRKATYLLGEKTFGKGSVQNIHSLSDGGSARITIAHWLTPNKNEIHTIGITPQYVVPYNEDSTSPVPCVAERRPPAGQTQCADSQLAWALKLLTSGETPPLPTAAK